jgi:FMN-dependent NADH-azoreductase
MKTMLYITANTKPEAQSASKSVGRAFVNEYMANHSEIVLKEMDLYNISIPKLKCEYFRDRNTLIDVNNANNLMQEDKQSISRITELAWEFKEADIYVLAVPMWNLMFPSVVKEYLDCVIQNDITVKISPDTITGLLHDKERKMIYIQSSGGPIPWIVEGRINHGGNYLKDIFKFAGISLFHEILVDSTGFTEADKQKAIDKGIREALKLAKTI